jgi:acyl-CoA synthetase (AMP-forming)/AMP-acid ligase II
MRPHSTYLWTLPMFHCNGWCFAWSMAANAGTNICLRRVEPAAIFAAIRHHGVTHMCGAPIVYNMMLGAPAEQREGIVARVNCLVAGAAPPAATIEGVERLGFTMTHVYGLTETYGPAAYCPQQPAWAGLPPEDRAARNARQGFAGPLQESMQVLDPATMLPVPADGQTIGEIMFRGNITMNGYLKNPQATEAAFAGGWFHTGARGRAAPPPRRQPRRRRRPPRCALGRSSLRLHRPKTRRIGDRRGNPRLLPRPHGRLQGAESRHIRPDPEDRHRQGAEIPVAPAGQVA